MTRIPCRFCQLRGDRDATHPVTHDGPQPPQPDKTWGVRCPCTHRFQLVDPARYEWEWEGRYIGYAVPIQNGLVLTEWS